MSSTSIATPSLPRWQRLLQSPWLHPLNDRVAINDLLGYADPMWSLGEARGKLVERRAETADCQTLRLQTNRWWRGHRAGQHVGVTVVINGVRHQRHYSISGSSAQNDWLELSIKRQAGGTVSNYLIDRLPLGAVVELSNAHGEFCLPTQATPSLLLIAAGSGITPIMAMLRELDRRDERADVVLLQISRTPQDRIFADELDALNTRWPQLRLINFYTGAGQRPDAAQLLQAVGDWTQRNTYLCGPAAFMATLEQHWQTQAPNAALYLERFGAPPARSDAGIDSAEVRCARSERVFAAGGGQPLLAEAERAGLQPKYGCRIGICRTCLCRKRSGTVQDLVNGDISSEPDQWIRLCVSSARSDLELDL